MKTMEIARKIGGVAHLKTANSGTPSKAPVLMPEKYSKSDVENAGASGDMYENTGSQKHDRLQGGVLPDPKRRFVNINPVTSAI